MDEMLLIRSVCFENNFGSLLEVPTKIEDNIEYKCYKAITEQKTIVIKIFKKKLTEKQIEKINYSLKIQEKLAKNDLPLSVSLNKNLSQINNKYYLIYSSFDGISILSKDIILEQCKKIGNILAKTHIIYFQKTEKVTLPYMHIRWRKYLRLAEHKGSSISQLLSENINLLEHATEICNNSLNSLPNVKTICYHNLDCSNVLWKNNELFIINSDKLSYGNPYVELLNTALIWSGEEEYKINYNLFNNVIKEYFELVEKPQINWQVIYNVNLVTKLRRIEYLVKSALMIDCNDYEEQLYGETNTKEAIKNIIYYLKIKEEVLSRLN